MSLKRDVYGHLIQSCSVPIKRPILVPRSNPRELIQAACSIYRASQHCIPRFKFFQSCFGALVCYSSRAGVFRSVFPASEDANSTPSHVNRRLLLLASLKYASQGLSSSTEGAEGLATLPARRWTSSRSSPCRTMQLRYQDKADLEMKSPAWYNWTWNGRRGTVM